MKVPCDQKEESLLPLPLLGGAAALLPSLNASNHPFRSLLRSQILAEIVHKLSLGIHQVHDDAVVHQIVLQEWVYRE